MLRFAITVILVGLVAPACGRTPSAPPGRRAGASDGGILVGGLIHETSDERGRPVDARDLRQPGPR